jgi:hypothetical protein
MMEVVLIMLPIVIMLKVAYLQHLKNVLMEPVLKKINNVKLLNVLQIYQSSVLMVSVSKLILLVKHSSNLETLECVLLKENIIFRVLMEDVSKALLNVDQ